MSPEVVVVLAIATFAAFVISSAVGLGGSLVLVPTLVIAVGAKEGVALAALLLACNNVVKVFAYRATLPFKKAGLVLACTILGAAIGASLLTAVPEQAVVAAVIASLGLSVLSGLWALYLKLVEGVSFILTPLPLLAVMLFMLGGMSILMGLLAEVIMRTYYEAQGKPVYQVRSSINLDEAS